MLVGGEEKRTSDSGGYGYNQAMVGHGGYNVDGNFEGDHSEGWNG